MGIFADAINGKRVSRAPVMAKIWLDWAARLLGRNWPELFSDPALSASTVVEAAIKTENDCSRLFLFAPRDVRTTEQGVFQWKNGRPIGKLDIGGGGATILDRDEDFDMEDPSMVIHYNAFRCRSPQMPTVADVSRLRIPTLEEYESIFGESISVCKRMAEGKIDLAGDCTSGTLSFCIAMNGMSKALMDLYDDPDLLHAMMEKGIDLCIQNARFLLSKGIRILRYNDSAANMMVISPSCWRAFIKPHLTRFCREVHSLCADAKIYCHICGDVRPILTDLLETGVDCIAPLDPMGGATIASVREVVGNSVMLMGGVNTLSFLNSSPEELRAEAKRCILEGMHNNGRFAVGSGCAVPCNASAESILALSQASKELEGN